MQPAPKHPTPGKRSLFAALGLLGLILATPVGAQELPPIDASYVDNDPAAQRVTRIDPEDRAARDALETGYRRDSRNPVVKLQYAEYQAERGMRKRVPRELLAAQRLTEEGSLLRRVVHYNAGWILLGIGDLDGAQEQWMEAYRLHGGHPDWAPPAFAVLLWTRGHPQLAMDYYALAARSQPERWGTAAGIESAIAGLSGNERFALQSMFDDYRRLQH